MAKEYIERCTNCTHYESCKEWATACFGETTNFPYEYPCSHFKSAADVAPVKHGRWIHVLIGNGWVNHQCSMCGYMKITNIDTTHDMNYCPNCGAKMDGGNDHD